MKYAYFKDKCNENKSPSMRREWIEIEKLIQKIIGQVVSLHAEGVD